jgi:hypothetical protein
MADVVVPLLEIQSNPLKLYYMVGLQQMRQVLSPRLPLDLVLIAHDCLGADILLDDSRIENANVNALSDVCITNNVVFEHVIFLQSSFVHVKLENCSFRNCTFWHVDWQKAALLKSNFVDCSFEDANLQESKWKKSYATKSSFLKCNLKRTHFVESTCCYLQLEDCNLCHIYKYKCKFRHWQLKNCRLPSLVSLSTCVFMVVCFILLSLSLSLYFASSFTVLPIWVLYLLPPCVIVVVAILCDAILLCNCTKQLLY